MSVKLYVKTLKSLTTIQSISIRFPVIFGNLTFKVLLQTGVGTIKKFYCLKAASINQQLERFQRIIRKVRQWDRKHSRLNTRNQPKSQLPSCPHNKSYALTTSRRNAELSRSDVNSKRA